MPWALEIALLQEDMRFIRQFNLNGLAGTLWTSVLAPNKR